jgi:hypothetical protein
MLDLVPGLLCVLCVFIRNVVEPPDDWKREKRLLENLIEHPRRVGNCGLLNRCCSFSSGCNGTSGRWGIEFSFWFDDTGKVYHLSTIPEENGRGCRTLRFLRVRILTFLLSMKVVQKEEGADRKIRADCVYGLIRRLA